MYNQFGYGIKFIDGKYIGILHFSKDVNVGDTFKVEDKWVEIVDKDEDGILYVKICDEN